MLAVAGRCVTQGSRASLPGPAHPMLGCMRPHTNTHTCAIRRCRRSSRSTACRPGAGRMTAHALVATAGWPTQSLG